MPWTKGHEEVSTCMAMLMRKWIRDWWVWWIAWRSESGKWSHGPVQAPKPPTCPVSSGKRSHREMRAPNGRNHLPSEPLCYRRQTQGYPNHTACSTPEAVLKRICAGDSSRSGSTSPDILPVLTTREYLRDPDFHQPLRPRPRRTRCTGGGQCPKNPHKRLREATRASFLLLM